MNKLPSYITNLGVTIRCMACKKKSTHIYYKPPTIPDTQLCRLCGTENLLVEQVSEDWNFRI